jgi:hypothetical protein
MKPHALATQFLFAIGLVMFVIAAPGPAAVAQGAPSAEERVATLKASLQENQARLRQYEWIEMTIISLKGEEKSRKQQRCYYGADGKVQKLPIGSQAAPAQQASGSRRGGRLKQRVVENKKEDMRDYMEQAAALIHQYVPPDPVRIQQAKDAGQVAITTPEPGRARVELTNYLQANDRLAIDIDAVAGHLSGVNLNTYLDTPEDAITLNARFGTLTDGTSYVAHTALDVTAKNIRVVIENSGHRLMAR